MWRGKSDLAPWLVAGGTAIVANRLFGGQWHIVVGALAGSLTGAALQQGKHHADQH
jgi:predicted branched-subunit amino acid permease